MKRIRNLLFVAVITPIMFSCGGGSSPDTADALDIAGEGGLEIGAALAASPSDNGTDEPQGASDSDVTGESSAPSELSAGSISDISTVDLVDRESSPIVREKVNVCEVTSLGSLRDCIDNASSYNGLDIKADLNCSNGNCCSQNGALVSLQGVAGFTIHGNSHLLKREDSQRQCSLLEIIGGDGVIVENWYMDDDVDTAGCLVGDNCPRMVHVRNSKAITFDNVNVSNGKGYNIYIDGVEEFTFQNSSIVNAGILGLYVGHGDNYSSKVTIENSRFVDVQTNAIALLGVAGNTTNIVRNNTFFRNHRHGHWAVAPQFGTGTTGGGQVYIARAQNVLIEGNTILDGYCDNCFVAEGSRTGIHGIELGEPGRASISNIEIRNNTIGNHDGSGVYLNQGNIIDSTIRISDNVLFNNTDGVQKALFDNGATIGSNDDRATAYFESFESNNVSGNEFSVSTFCASDSSVERQCSGERLHGSCAVTLTVDGQSCDDASVSLSSRWYQLNSGDRTAASGWVINRNSTSIVNGDWCMEFSDDEGSITGIECQAISVNDSTSQTIHGLPSLDVEPPLNSTRVRWVARNRSVDPLSLDDIKIGGVR